MPPACPVDPSLQFRPARASDAPALLALVEHLSRIERHWRFHGAVNGLAPSAALRWASPGADAVALVVDAPSGDGLIAEARWTVDASGSAAEAALSVDGGWRHRGLGRRGLAALLQAAAERGLRWLYGQVLADNRPMLQLVRRSGGRCHPRRDDARVVIVEFRVDAALATNGGLA